MERVIISRHAADQMVQRGASDEEVRETVGTGQPELAKNGRIARRKTFAHGREWRGRWYDSKQVLCIVAEERDALVVVTVLVFYF